MQYSRNTLILILGSLLLAGCGLKGALYLPDEEPPQVNAPEQDPFAQKSNEVEEDEDG